MPLPDQLDLTLTMRQNDLTDGTPQSCVNCPIARALKRDAAHALGYPTDPIDVWVNFGKLFVECLTPDRIITYMADTPAALHTFMSDYDGWSALRPALDVLPSTPLTFTRLDIP